MKKKFIIAIIFIISFSSIAFAEEKFCVEENDLVPVSKSIVDLILSFENNSDWKRCNFIGKPIDLDGDGKLEDFVVTTDSGCGCGNVKCTIWVIRKLESSYKVVLSKPGYSVGFSKRKINGLAIVSFNSASAGWSDSGYWAFVGGKYQNFFTSSEVNDPMDKNPVSSTWINVFASNAKIKKFKVNVVRHVDGKKSIITNFGNDHAGKKLKTQFSPDTYIYSLIIEKVGGEFYTTFIAETKKWKAYYCWDILKNKLHFISRNKKTNKTYYSKNFEKNNICSELLKQKSQHGSS